ncbi:MAG: hypothetical protein IPF42_02810 [Candidatus Microthrix sp.]|nr:hypothetical protein [Candidatus Microthrix sp.]
MAASPQTTLRPLVAILEELATHPPPPVRGTPLDELRHLLEGAARTAVAGVPAGSLPLRAPKSAIADAIRCARFAAARRSIGFEAGSPDAQRRRRRGVAADVLVAHVLAGGALNEPAAQIVLDAWEARGEHNEIAAVANPGRLRSGRASTRTASSWPPGCARLDGPPVGRRRRGRRRTVVAPQPEHRSGGAGRRRRRHHHAARRRAGRPGRRPPPALIEVKATAPAHDHSFDLNLYALGIGLRDGLAPAAVLHWSPGTGWVELPPVTIEVLESAARRVVHALGVLGSLARGETPEETPGAHCGWCPDAAICPSANPSAQRKGDMR